MTWWQTLIVMLATYTITKLVDLYISIVSEKREFKKRRRDLALPDIEKLKDKVGTLYELAANWKGFDKKQKAYIEAFEKDHELIGRLNKYPPVAKAANDVVHWCMIVASNERNNSESTASEKKELTEKYKIFLEACDKYLDNLV